MRALIVDALAAGKGERKATKDALGAGPRAVAGVLEGLGVECQIMESERVNRSSFTGFGLLLVSGMSVDLPAIRDVVSHWRNGPVVIGGPAACEPEKALRRSRANLAVIGEGEEILTELLRGGLLEGHLPDKKRLSEIRGIAYTDRGEVKVNPLRAASKRVELDSHRPSAERVRDYHLYRSARVYVEVLRGCSNYHRATVNTGCTDCGRCREGTLTERYDCPEGIPPGCGYCSVPSLFGPARSRSVERIVDEVSGLVDLGVPRIVLSAPCFLDYGRDLLVEPEPLTDPRSPEPNYEQVESLLHELSEVRRIHEGAVGLLLENLKASLVTEKAAAILGRYLPGSPVSIGYESGCPDHCIALGRSSTPEETLTAIRRLRQAGLKPYAYFIHGLPGQTEKTVERSVEAIHRSVQAGADRIILYRFMSLPMSAFSAEPGAPPSVKDPLSRRIHDAAREANMSAKRDLIGSTLRVVVAEPYDRDTRYLVAYPLLHGPVMLLEAAGIPEGTVLDARVTGVASDRIVYGSHPDARFI